MSDQLTFMMGEFEAEFFTDRSYGKNHMWAIEHDGKVRFGFTAYAVRLLQDVYFLDWLIDAPVSVDAGQEIGAIESKKAESALYAPVAGQIIEFNDSLMDDPSAINTDKYGKGWLFEMSLETDLNSFEEILSPDQYIELLDDVWEKTQRTIKGQLNE